MLFKPGVAKVVDIDTKPTGEVDLKNPNIIMYTMVLYYFWKINFLEIFEPLFVTKINIQNFCDVANHLIYDIF